MDRGARHSKQPVRDAGGCADRVLIGDIARGLSRLGVVLGYTALWPVLILVPAASGR